MSKLRAYFIEEFLAGKTLSPVQLSTREGPPRLAMPNINLHVRAVGNPEDRTLEFVGSDETLDRYEEILSVSGWDLKNYRLNPVLLFGHDYHGPSIGHAVKVWKNLEVDAKQLLFHQRFAKAETYSFADTIYRLYLDGDMRTVSVGFLPWDWEDPEQEDEPARGAKPTAPRRIYKKQELLELSCVPVPANPNALVNAMQRGIIREAEFNLLTQKYRMPAEREVIDLGSWASLREPERPVEVEAFSETEAPAPEHRYFCGECGKEMPEPSCNPCADCQSVAGNKGVGPFSAHGSLDQKFSEGTPWDAAAARARMRKWAGVDAEQAPASAWTKYRQGHAWFDSAAADTLGAYKLPHHDIQNGGLAHHWRGTVAAMTALLGGRGGTAIPEGDRKGCWVHLGKEYVVFDKPVPDFKSYETIEDVLSGTKDADTAVALWAAINDTVFQDGVPLPEPLTAKWPELGKPKAAPPISEASTLPKTCLVEFVSLDFTGRIRLIAISAELFEQMAALSGTKIEWEEQFGADPFGERLIDLARSLASQRAFDSLPADRQAAIRSTVPEGEQVDPLLFGDFAKVYLDLLHGTTMVEIRAGAVLNKRNLGRVKAIMQHAQEILAEAEPAAEEPVQDALPPQTDAAPDSTVPESCPGATTQQGPPELEIIEVLHTPETPPEPVEVELTLDVPVSIPTPEAPEIIIELEAVAPTEAAPSLPATPAPPSPSGQEDPVIEVDAEQLAAAVAQGIEQALGGLTGDARSARGKRRK